MRKNEAPTWYKLPLGDATIAEAGLDTIADHFDGDWKSAGSPPGMAIFTRIEGGDGPHCQLIVYLTPESSAAARQCGARPCAAPSRHGMRLHTGSAQCWDLLPPHDS